MMLGMVMGSVVASAKSAKTDGLKMLIVQPLDLEGKPKGQYVVAFDAVGALHKLEGFASHHGADFYGLPRNTGSVTLARQPWLLPDGLPFGDAVLKPLRGGETLAWRQAD